MSLQLSNFTRVSAILSLLIFVHSSISQIPYPTPVPFSQAVQPYIRYATANPRYTFPIDGAQKVYLLDSVIAYFEAWRGNLREMPDSERTFPITDKTLQPINSFLSTIHRSESTKFSKRIAETYKKLTACNPSRQKTLVFLKYIDVVNPIELNENWVVSIRKQLAEVIEDAHRISDYGEQVIADKIVADLAATYGTYDLSMQEYYNAKDLIFNSSATEKIKQIEQAKIEYALGLLYSSLSIRGVLNKAEAHVINAWELARSAHENALADRYLMQALSLKTPFADQYSGSIASAIDANTLHTALPIFNAYQQGRISDDNLRNYYMLTTVGAVLQRQNFSHESIFFFVHAARIAQQKENLQLYISALNGIIISYAQLEDRKLTGRYLALVLRSMKGNKLSPFESAKEMIVQANVLSKLREFESAVSIGNEIVNDDDIARNMLTPIQSASVAQDGFDILRRSYKTLNNYDSARYYDSLYNYAQHTTARLFSSLLQSEETAVTGWIERTKNKEINLEIGLKKLALRSQRLEKLRADTSEEYYANERHKNDTLLIRSQKIQLEKNNETIRANNETIRADKEAIRANIWLIVGLGAKSDRIDQLIPN